MVRDHIFTSHVKVEGSMTPVVGNKDICTEGLGPCGTNCDARCKAQHSPNENPQGSCDQIGSSISLCNCLYSCDRSTPMPKPPLNCISGLGLCTAQCKSDCCNAKCGQQYKGGEGFCDTNVGVSLCQCSHPC
ncbi:defensin-like protein 182 [Cucumis sativus]|nr:defensin-like protein 182 [Cucumis sativus]XP_031736571.1 defensin-like protein 182 [Cucumis sativus]